MSFTRKLELVEYEYTIDGVALKRCVINKDLDIWFDSKLNFVEHVNQTVASAFKSYGFIYRNCKGFRNVDSLKVLFFAFVRSKLEYGFLIWYPIYSIHIDHIESVQRRFLKYLMFMEDGVYPERGYDYSIMLNRFSFSPLRDRHVTSAVKFLYKLLNNNIDCPYLLSEINFNVPRLSVRQHTSFYCPPSRTNVMAKSPISNMCTLYNIISNSCYIHFDSFVNVSKAISNF